MTIDVYFNPACSKCRAAKDLLEARGIEARYIHYLDTPPTRAELEALLTKLGSNDPRAMMRTSDPRWTELRLDTASRDQLLDALAANPALLERPIVVRAERAIVARPPEKLLTLLDD